jgi:hypothetical protein
MAACPYVAPKLASGAAPQSKHMSVLDAGNTNYRAPAAGTMLKYLINKSQFRPGYASKRR